jgi:hypothetical protein
MFVPTPVVQVRWEWSTLIACQIVLSAAVLVLTTRLTKASGLSRLRDSSLSTMCSLDQSTQDFLRQCDDLEMRDRTAKSVRVKLESSGSGDWMSLVEVREAEGKVGVLGSGKLDGDISGVVVKVLPVFEPDKDPSFR